MLLNDKIANSTAQHSTAQLSTSILDIGVGLTNIIRDG